MTEPSGMAPPAHPDREVVQEAVDLAVRAPSIHNTQPWQWRSSSTTLELYADRTRQLSSADPFGRSLLISCGASLHHLVVAMAARGWSSKIRRLPDDLLPSLLAAITFEPREPTDDVLAWADAIPRRRTDRRPMSSWEVSSGHVQSLVGVAAEHGVILQPLSNPFDAHIWDALSQRVTGQRAEDRSYQGELSRWLGRDPSAVEGLPASNLLEPGESSWGAGAEDRFPAGSLPRPSEEGEPPYSVPLLLCTSSDDPLSRLRAGEALSAVLLEATRWGLATRLESQVIEVESTRVELEEQLLHGTRSPQILIRLGWPAGTEEVPPTPRRGREQVLKVSDAPSMSERLARGAAARHTPSEGGSR